MKINFPILFYFDRTLVVDDGIGIKAMGGKFTPERTFLCKECHLEEPPAWLLEADGKFTELIPSGKKREWARFLSKFWRFTLSEFQASTRREITVGELQAKISKIKDKYTGAPIAKDLRRHLDTCKSEQIVDEKLLNAWPL